jgi:hypothetical protein
MQGRRVSGRMCRYLEALMAPRFSRPRLIDADDPHYQAFMRQIMLTRANQRGTRPPRARDLFGGEVEAALRAWLADRVTLSPKRIVEYVEQRGNSAVKKYRELDGVVLVDSQTVHVYEMKASHRAGSVRRAAQQLRDTRAILHLMFKRVYATIMLVDTGIPTPEDVALIMDAPDAPEYPPQTLDDVLAKLPDIQRIPSVTEHAPDPAITSLLLFTVPDIVAMAGAENLHLDWEEDDEDEEPPLRPTVLYSTADEDGDDNPLAQALRRAMRGGGGA